MNWFTADHHFGHKNIIEYTHRPFDTVEEMDYELIRRWNSVVKPDDEVFHLGDFTFSGGSNAGDYFSRLNGKINILGYSWHHDKQWLNEAKLTGFYSFTGQRIKVLSPMAVLEFPGLGDGKWPLVIVLCHYPMAVWDRSHYGSMHLHGHSHCLHKSVGLSMDVGVDCHGFTPVSLETIVTVGRMTGA